MKYTSKFSIISLIPFVFGSMLLSSVSLGAPDDQQSGEQDSYGKVAPSHKKHDDISFGDYLAGKFAQSNGDNEKSIKFLSESLQRDPDNKEIVSDLYHALISANNIDTAVTMAKKLDNTKLMDDGSEFSPRLILAVDAAKRGHYDESAKYLQSMPKMGFNSMLIPLMQAWLQFANGQIKGPINAKDIMPNGKMLLPDIYLNAAFINDISGFDPEAIQQYEDAAKETRTESLRSAEALINYYNRHANKEKYKAFADEYTALHGETIIDSEGFSEQKPKLLVSNANEGLAEALYTVASIFHGVRAPEDETTTLRIALYLRPDFSAASFLLANTYELGRSYKNAIDAYKAIGQNSPYFIQSRIMMAYDRSELGDKEGAIAELDKIAAEKPAMISALLAKGDILRMSNKFPEAIEAYEAAITRKKTVQRPNWVIYFSRGICYDRIGNFDKTEEDMKTALKLNPGEPDVLNYLGYSWLIKHHNIEQAKKMIEEAYDARPEDAQIIDSMGYALYLEGDFKSAQEYFEQALERIPDDPTVNEHLGDTYWQLGRKTEAGYQWQRAIENKPDERNRKLLLNKLSNGLDVIAPKNNEISKEDGRKSSKSPEIQ